jgi:hypothetical protein
MERRGRTRGNVNVQHPTSRQTISAFLSRNILFEIGRSLHLLPALMRTLATLVFQS